MNARFDINHVGCLVFSSSSLAFSRAPKTYGGNPFYGIYQKCIQQPRTYFFIIPTFSIVNDQQPLTIFIVTTSLSSWYIPLLAIIPHNIPFSGKCVCKCGIDVHIQCFFSATSRSGPT